jgi:hypothetical protein
MGLLTILENNYNLVENASEYGKAEIFYCAIQIKSHRPELINVNQSIYTDIKMFVKYYIESLDDRDYGYDSFNNLKIRKAIDYAQNNNEKYSLTKYTLRQLLKFELEDEINEFKKLSHIYKSKVLFDKKQFLLFALNLTTYNWIAILATILLIMLLNVIIFQPAPFKSWEILDLKLHYYNGNTIINSVSNVLAFVFSIKGKFDVTPNCTRGVFLIVFLKFLYISIILNYLYKKVIELIK